jgi:hypothetical protein
VTSWRTRIRIIYIYIGYIDITQLSGWGISELRCSQLPDWEGGPGPGQVRSGPRLRYPGNPRLEPGLAGIGPETGTEQICRKRAQRVISASRASADGARADQAPTAPAPMAQVEMVLTEVSGTLGTAANGWGRQKTSWKPSMCLSFDLRREWWLRAQLTVSCFSRVWLGIELRAEA